MTQRGRDQTIILADPLLLNLTQPSARQNGTSLHNTLIEQQKLKTNQHHQPQSRRLFLKKTRSNLLTAATETQTKRDQTGKQGHEKKKHIIDQQDRGRMDGPARALIWQPTDPSVTNRHPHKYFKHGGEIHESFILKIFGPMPALYRVH